MSKVNVFAPADRSAYVWALSSLVLTAVPSLVAVLPAPTPQPAGKVPAPTKAYPPTPPPEHWVRTRPAAQPARRSLPRRPAPVPSARLYRVQWGDTLWGLAQRYRVTVEALQKANGLGQSTFIEAGATLVVPATVEARAGDSWATLARRLHVSPARLRQWNTQLGAQPPPGSVVVVPYSGPVPAPAATPRPAALPARAAPLDPAQLSSNDVVLLAHLVQAEAGNQPFVGQVAVAAVVLNRLRSPEFPKTLQAVVFQPGQFESVANGSFWNPPSNQALKAVRAAQTGWDPTGGALYFYNPALTRDHWITTLPVVARIGEQVFAR